MADNTIDITRRKILASIGTVGAAGAAAGYGTSALFSDEEEFENNTFAAGELDLVVDWEEHYSFPQLYGFDDPTDGLDVTRSKPNNSSDYVGLPDPMNPVVWVDESDLDDYMSNTAIEAFPDPDNDGEQEVSTNDGFTYEPCTDGANLPDDLGVTGLRTDNAHTDPEDDGGSPPLIQLEDVKPGDFGEFTLSFHLCDNPGYVWLQAANDSEDGGANPEPEQEAEGGDGNDPTLAEKIETIWWYDARGDNVPPRSDCEEALYLSDSDTDPTTLYEVELDGGAGEANLTELLGTGDYSNSNFNQVDAIAATPNGDKVIFYDKNSGHLGEYDVGSGSFDDEGSITDDPGAVVLAGYSPDGTLWAASQDDNNLYTVDTSAPSANSEGDTGIDLSGADLAFAADGTMYIWTSSSSQNGLYKVDDPSSDTTAVAVDSSNIGTLDTDVTGMAIRDAGNGNILVSDNNDDEIIVIDRTDGSRIDSYAMKENGSDFDHIFGDMTAGQLCGQVFRRSNLRSDLDALTSSPVPLDGNRSTSFDEFNGSDDSSNRECFAAGVTHYIGFGWWVPTDVGNEIMGDSVEFDLGFYTEQCRNQDGSYDA